MLTNIRIVSRSYLLMASVAMLVFFILSGKNASASGPVLNFARDATLSINVQGAIRDLECSGRQLMLESKLAGKCDSQTLYQASGGVMGNKAEVKGGESSVFVTGVLISPQSKGDPAGIAEFNITYTKEEKDSIRIHIEVTHLTDANWSEPISFSFKFPLAMFQGGECVIQSATSEKTHVIDHGSRELKGYGLKKCTLKKGKESISIEAATEAQLSIIDGRGFGANFIRVDASRQMPYVKSRAISAGQKVVFETVLSVRTE